MKRALLFVALLWILALSLSATSHAAPLSTEQKSLEPIASEIAGQQLEVRCYLNDGQDPDSEPDAWGYTYLPLPIIYLDPDVCAGALALQRGTVAPLWQLGIGALTLTHEAYHQKSALPDWRRGSESQTECRAVKRVPQTLLDLGATQALADAVLPWALAEHFKISTFDSYDYPSCKVPGFEFWS